MGATMHTWSSWRACLPKAAPSQCAWMPCPSWSPRWLQLVPGGSAQEGPSSRRIPATVCYRCAAHTSLLEEHTSLSEIGHDGPQLSGGKSWFSYTGLQFLFIIEYNFSSSWVKRMKKAESLCG